MCKLSKKLMLQRSRSARRLLIFLCNVLICAFVYNQNVHAATLYSLLLSSSGILFPSDGSGLDFDVMGQSYQSLSSSGSFHYIESNGSGYFNFSTSDTIFYDVVIPCNLVQHPDSTTLPSSRFYVATDLDLIFDIKQSSFADVNFLSVYIDGVGVSSVYDLSDERNTVKYFDKIAPNEYRRFVITSIFDNLYFNNCRSATFDVHFLFYSSSHNTTVSGVTIELPALMSFNVLSYYRYFISSDDFISNDTAVGKLQDIDDTIRDQRQDDYDKADQAGSDATDLVSNLDTQIKSKWEILWYPIEFTQDLFGVFTGSTSRSYSNAGIVGYSYNSRDGTLEPVIDYTRAAVRAVQGTTITFPSFSIMGLKVWDAYDYDLSQVKSDFPALFDAIYVIISILEVYWFVSFLISKYEEVFG